MKLTHHHPLKFPKLTELVSQTLPKLADDSQVQRAALKWGQMNTLALSKALAFESGPEIDVLLTWAWRSEGAWHGTLGWFRRNKPEKIHVSRQLVKDMESGHCRVETKRGTVTLVEITLMHELTHWSDFWHDGKERKIEVGEKFVHEVYGNFGSR